MGLQKKKAFSFYIHKKTVFCLLCQSGPFYILTQKEKILYLIWKKSESQNIVSFFSYHNFSMKNMRNDIFVLSWPAYLDFFVIYLDTKVQKCRLINNTYNNFIFGIHSFAYLKKIVYIWRYNKHICYIFINTLQILEKK